MDFGKGNIEASRKKELRALRLDLELYQQELEDPVNFLRRSGIQEKIDQTQAQIEALENAQPAPLNTLLLNGLQNNIDDIDRKLEREKDIKKREQLQTKQRELREALNARQAPISNPDEFNEAVDLVQSDQRLLDSLSDGRIDEVDLYMLANSDMLAFMDHEFQGRIKIAMEQMVTSDLTRAAKGKQTEERFIEADKAWFRFKEENEQYIGTLQGERGELISQISGADTQKRERLRREIREKEDEIRNLHAELQKGRIQWTHDYRTSHELADTSEGFSEIMDRTTQEQFTQLITEAQAIRTERVQDYMAREVSALETQFQEVRGQKIFSQQTIEKIEAELAEARELIVNQKITDPKKLRKLANNFESAKMSLSMSAEEVRQAVKQRPQLETQAQQDYAEIKAVLQSLDPKKIKALKEKYIAEIQAKGISEDSKIAEKGLQRLEALAGDNITIEIRDDKTGQVTETVQMHSAIAAFEARLQDPSQMSAEELLLLSQDLKQFKRKIDHLKKLNANIEEALSPENQEAKLAHETIAQLNRAEAPEDIKHILEEKLGAEHLEFKAHSAFRKDHGSRTKEGEGHMVFQEEGAAWKIIIDESVFAETKAVEKLKKQLTHELLHLEFEKSSRVKEDVRKAMKTDKTKWREVSDTFREMAWEEKKYPPGWTEADEAITSRTERKKRFNELWGDDDILSELYAMQNEMGRTWSKENSAKARLNNLLTGMGAAASMGNIGEKTDEYLNDPEVIKRTERGYEAGIDEDEVPEDAGRLSIKSSASLTKEAAVYQSNKEQINHINDRIDEIKKSEYLGKIPGGTELVEAIKGYNAATAGMNEDVRRNPEKEIFAADVKARISKMSGDLTEVEDRLGKAARIAPNTEIGLLRDLWNRTSFLCMQDFVQMGADVYEFIQRRHKRKVADHAARLGMALFSGTDVGREARARQQKAEAEEVNEWKSRYENLDAWQLMDEMKGIANSLIPNQDQLKAILRILADKGRLDWRDENLWRCLNKLQSAVVLKPGDQILLHNPVLLRQRLHTALGEIYDYDEFPTLERTNESSYQSGKGKYDTLHSRMQDKLTGRLDELLSQHKAGEQVEPMLYESIMEYCIKNGKSYAENVMFHLIAGMATGLLAPDRGLALGDHLNAWPAVDWFTSFSPPMSQSDWKKLCMDYFPDDFIRGSITAEGYGENFKNFYWTVIQNHHKVIERVKKSVGERGWDHDWGRSIAPLGDANTAKRFLSGRSGQEETKNTAVGNAYVGAVMWLEENARNPQAASKDNFARIAGWITMSEGMLDGSAFKEASKDINTRANEAMNNDVPREAGVGRHGEANLKQHRDMAKAFLIEIDPQFFTMIMGREARTKETKAQMGIQARDYLLGNPRYQGIANQIADIEDIDQIYERIDLIIGEMFRKMPKAEFQKILTKIASGIK